MRRISVVGSTGAGKTTTARAIAAALDLPVLELDSIFHQPDWTPLDNAEFRRRVAAFVEGDAWVVDGNYTGNGVAEIARRRADTIVWLDMPLGLVMRRIIGRTLRRVFTREELWNGNRERLVNMFDPRPEHNIIVWALTRHGSRRASYERASTDGTWGHAEVHRLSSPEAASGFVESLSGAPQPDAATGPR